MEARDHFKNGVSLKTHTSRGKFSRKSLSITKILTYFTTVFQRVLMVLRLFVKIKKQKEYY